MGWQRNLYLRAEDMKPTAMFRKKVHFFIVQKRLLPAQATVLVALSGGADSVALLRVLLDIGYRCQAAHCNFHLRGEESDRDEAFVRQLCSRLDVPLHVTAFDTHAVAAQEKISIEMAARQLRYAWFERLKDETGACAIAVAHHRDDSVETLLLNLVRGTGIAGLCGIRPVNGSVVRPLLCVSRSEILGYLASIGQDYVTDSTNLQDVFTRNKIRLDILPLLQDINPAASASIAATADRLADVEAVYRKAMHEACRRVEQEPGHISLTQLLAEISPQSVLFELLHDKGFNAAQLQDIWHSLSSTSGRLFRSDRYELLRDRDAFLLRPLHAAATCLPLLHSRFFVTTTAFEVPRRTDRAYLDADSLPSDHLMIRRWQSGDRFVPFGMNGFKRVRDYLRDHKFSRFQKEEQCVVCSGTEIVWLVGERTDNRFRVTPQTRRIVEIWWS